MSSIQLLVEQLVTLSRPNHVRVLVLPQRALYPSGSKDPHSILILHSRHLSKSLFPVPREPSSLNRKTRPVKGWLAYPSPCPALSSSALRVMPQTAKSNQLPKARQ
jgi:hypothetical protein